MLYLDICDSVLRQTTDVSVLNKKVGIIIWSRLLFRSVSFQSCVRGTSVAVVAVTEPVATVTE